MDVFYKKHPSEDNKNQKSSKFNVSTFIMLIPVITSTVCAVYVILFYSYIKNMNNFIEDIQLTLNNLNHTKLNIMFQNLYSLEDCLVHNLPFCN
jgi:hypothetical protein